jgi:hypothetical protein
VICLEVLRQAMERRPTLSDVEVALREVVTDPLLCEHCVGHLYGQAFRDRERAADGDVIA